MANGSSLNITFIRENETLDDLRKWEVVLCILFDVIMAINPPEMYSVLDGIIKNYITGMVSIFIIQFPKNRGFQKYNDSQYFNICFV